MSEKILLTPKYEKILSIAFYSGFFSSVTTYVLIAIKLPSGGWDAWAIWNLHARFVFRGREYWTDVFSNYLATASHPDYPFLVPATVARFWEYIGRETQLVPALVAISFTFATVGLFYSVLIILRSKSQAYLACLILFSNVSFIVLGTYQYADVPLGFYFLATFILFFFQERLPNNFTFSLVAGMMSGFAGWTKNEGLLFLVSIFTARLLVALISNDRRTHMKQLLYFTFGVTPVLAVILYFKIHYAPASDLMQGQGLPQLIEKIGQASRYLVILKSFIAITISVFPQLILLLMYFLFFGIKIDRHRIGVITSLFALFFMISGYCLVYVITPYDLSWHLGSSLSRLLLQVWPSVLLTYFMIVRTPEEALSEVRVNQPIGS